MASAVEMFDVVISFDTTGSMYGCIDTVKSRMRDIMKKLQSDIPEIRLGVIAHGDYDTSRVYIIQYENLTSDVNRLCSFVTSARGTGGGFASNSDEAYELSLNYARTKLGWRSNSNKVLIMIGDCRPHEKDYFLNKEKINWTQEIVYLRNMGVKIYAVQCEARAYADSFYQKIASSTFGDHVPLSDIKKVEEVLMSICYREAGLKQTQTFSQLSLASPVMSTVISSPTVRALSPVSADASASGISDDEESDEEQLGLICPLCKVGKLATEYPPCTISTDCYHASLICLRCVIKHVSNNGTCPQEGCDVLVDRACDNMKLFQAILDRMFVDYSKVLEQNKLASRPEGDVISVATITGETEWFPYRANMRIAELKIDIGTKLKLKPEQQRLIYNETSLKADMRLSDYDIPKNATLSLILPLYCIPEHLDHVVFDLSWEFPAINPDFLDATCMAFEKTEFIQVIDWNHPTNAYYMKGAVKHSEKNLTGPGAKTGHQTIHVHLKKVPSNITHLYFVLSSWRSPDLSSFHNPSLKFYEASSENIDLCETTFTHALHSQAVIMCYAVRIPGRRDWQIYECGAGGLVNGNAKRYNPVRQRIAELIDSE